MMSLHISSRMYLAMRQYSPSFASAMGIGACLMISSSGMKIIALGSVLNFLSTRHKSDLKRANIFLTKLLYLVVDDSNMS